MKNKHLIAKQFSKLYFYIDLGIISCCCIAWGAEELFMQIEFPCLSVMVPHLFLSDTGRDMIQMPGIICRLYWI